MSKEGACSVVVKVLFLWLTMLSVGLWFVACVCVSLSLSLSLAPQKPPRYLRSPRYQRPIVAVCAIFCCTQWNKIKSEATERRSKLRCAICMAVVKLSQVDS